MVGAASGKLPWPELMQPVKGGIVLVVITHEWDYHMCSSLCMSLLDPSMQAFKSQCVLQLPVATGTCICMHASVLLCVCTIGQHQVISMCLNYRASDMAAAALMSR